MPFNAYNMQHAEVSPPTEETFWLVPKQKEHVVNLQNLNQIKHNISEANKKTVLPVLHRSHKCHHNITITSYTLLTFHLIAFLKLLWSTLMGRSPRS